MTRRLPPPDIDCNPDPSTLRSITSPLARFSEGNCAVARRALILRLLPLHKPLWALGALPRASLAGNTRAFHRWIQLESSGTRDLAPTRRNRRLRGPRSSQAPSGWCLKCYSSAAGTPHRASRVRIGASPAACTRSSCGPVRWVTYRALRCVQQHRSGGSCLACFARPWAGSLIICRPAPRMSRPLLNLATIRTLQASWQKRSSSVRRPKRRARLMVAAVRASLLRRAMLKTLTVPVGRRRGGRALPANGRI